MLESSFDFRRKNFREFGIDSIVFWKGKNNLHKKMICSGWIDSYRENSDRRTRGEEATVEVERSKSERGNGEFKDLHKFRFFP